MALRNVSKDNTFEQQRVIINEVAADVGDLSTLSTGNKSNIVSAINEVESVSGQVDLSPDIASVSDLTVPFLPSTTTPNTLRYNTGLTYSPSSSTFKTKNLRINDATGTISLPVGSAQSPPLYFEAAGRSKVGFYRVNDQVGVGFEGRPPNIFFNPDGTITSAGVQTSNASELQLTNNPKCLYVSEQEYYASDSWTNTGLSLNKPFKTITRALLEAARQSYVIDNDPGANNDKFEYFTIIVFPGNYEIDNRPGSSLTVENAINFFEDRNNYGPTGKVGSVVAANLVTTKISTFPYNASTITLDSSTGLTSGLRVVGSGIPEGAFISSSYSGGNTITLVNSSGGAIQTVSAQTAVSIDFYQSSALRTASEYINVPSSGGSGSGATFNVRFTGTGVDGNIIVTPSELGTGYYPNERLTIASSSLGNTGALTILITDLFDDSELAIQTNLYRLNPPSGGVIVPRGTSIVGLDLRKTVIRPKYVPDPTIPPSGDQRAQDAANLIKSNREYIISEAFGYLQSNTTKKTVSTITQGLILYDNTGTVNDIYEPDVFTCTGHGFVENTPIKFVNIPASGVTLYPNQVYYVDYIDANSFRVKASKNTSPLSTIVTATQSSLGSLAAYSFNTGSQSCKRDIGYYIDALSYDISRGGNSKTFDNAEFYITGASTQLIKGATEIFDTLACLKYATNLAASAVRNHEFKIRATRNGTTTLTLSSAQYGLTIGMNVSGTGIAAGTKISSITYAANGSVTAVTLSSAASGSGADDYTFSARNVYNYAFVTPYYETKFDSYPFFDNIYKTSGTAYTPECSSVVNALFTLYNVFNVIINNPSTYIVSSSGNYVQKSYPYGYDRDLETALFRVTGGCYFWQMTFKDGSTDATSLPWYVNSSGVLTQYNTLQNEPNDAQKEAYRILTENRNTIINTTYTALLSYIQINFPSFTFGAPIASTTAVIDQYKAKCKRDIGYIFDAVATDIFDGGTANTFDSILYYLNATQDGLTSNGLAGETDQSIYAFQQLRNNMQLFVQDSVDINGINIDTKIATLIGYLTDSLNSPGTVSISLRNENNNTGQFPCSHHRLVAFKFANRQELAEYYDKIEALYNANFDPDIPATSTSKIVSITNDSTGDIFTTELNHNYDENTPVKFRPFTVPGVSINRYKTYYIKYIAKNKFQLKNSSSVIPYVSNQAADAYNLVLKNLNIIATEAYYQYNSSSPIVLPTNSTATDCLDDVKDVLKAIMYNVKYGYNDKAYEAGYIYATGRYVTNNKPQTIAVLQKARDYAISSMRNIVFFETRSFQTISRSGTLVTVVTPTAHGFSTGDKVNIDASNNNLDITEATITVTSTTQFTYNTVASGTIATGSTGTYRRSDSALFVDTSVTNDPNTPKCISVADAINTLMTIVTTAIDTETMDHVTKTVPPITPTEDTEEVLANIVSSTQSSLAIYIYDVDAYSQRVEENRIVGDASKNTTIDTVSSASPYIFNCSLRSVYGMSGMHANGEDATGFKSMVLAQYTGISLQRDNRAFTRLNYLNGLPTNKVNAADTRFTKVDSEYIDYWRNYHVKASNDGFLQVVSVFAVGFADHFVSDTGSDISITNSNSNFGNIATLSAGYKAKAFPQDTRGQIVGIIPPKGIDYSRTNSVILDEIDYRTITKWSESRIINGGVGENKFGKIYIKSTSVNGLYEKDGLPEYTDSSGNKWLLIDGVNYLLGRGKNIAYQSAGNNYETGSTQNEYLYGSFAKFIGSTEQGEFRSRLRQRNPNNSLDAQISYDVKVGSSRTGISYSTTQSSFVVLDATGIIPGQKIGSSLSGLNGAYVANSYVSGSLTIPMTTSNGTTPFFPTANQSNATISFYRVLDTADNAKRQFYGWEYAETTASGEDLGSLVIYVDEFVMYDDLFYHNDYLTYVQGQAIIAGTNAAFPGGGTLSAGTSSDPSGNPSSGIALNYNSEYTYAYGNLLKRILQRYDSDVNFALTTSDALEFTEGATIANAYIKRVTDSRLAKDHIWKFIYKIPKESNAKPPERKYVIQVLLDDAPSYSKSYYIYDVETIDEYVADTQDGIYYLTVLDANVNTIKNSVDLLKIGYGQNQYFLYPEVNLDNPEWNPKEAISVYNNDVKIRTIVLEDANLVADSYERVTSYSITAELTKNFVNYITDKNCRQTTFPAGALSSSATNSIFSNIKQIYTSNIDNSLGIVADVFSGSSLSNRVIKFKRICSASPNNNKLINVTDIEKLVVGAELIAIAPAGGGTLTGGVTYTVTNIDIETRTVTLSSSIGVSNTTTYTYTFNNPISVKIHRPSNIRASGHTWEYVGYGPGNYSTAFPVFQTIVLNRQQIINSQTIERNGGFNGSSGTNSNGDFFIGTQVIDTKGSQSETVNVPKLKTSAQNRLVDPTDLLFITAASSSGTGNLSAFSENLQNTVRTQLSDQSSKTVTYDKVTVANLEVGTNIKISGSIDIRNSNMNATDTTLLFPTFSADGRKYGFAKRVNSETINWTASRQALPEDGFVTARDLGEWAYINRVTGSAAPQAWQTIPDGQFLYAGKTEGVNRYYTFQYGSNFTYNVTAAQLNITDFFLKIGKVPTSVLTQNIGLSGFIYVNVSAISASYPVIKGIDPSDVNGGVEWKALKNAWLNPSTSENGVSGNFVISYYIHSPLLIIYNVNPFEV